MRFSIEKKIPGARGRTGKIKTSHGVIETPAYFIVGTKATVKAVTPAELKEIGIEAVLANTYHLYLEPGDEVIRDAGGLGKFMGWHGPTITDSGGFQVFSLGSGFGKGVTKFGKKEGEASIVPQKKGESQEGKLVSIDEEGVWFTSYKDGSKHRFTPERSMEIQHNIGADIMFAFDECPSSDDPVEYQRKAMERTHRWAERGIAYHKKMGKDKTQALFGIVQGGRFEELRRESAEKIGGMDFPGFGIGGTFTKEDLSPVLGLVNSILPEEKPRHLLGIGEVEDIFFAVEQGIDTFDCVLPTRAGRNGTLYTKNGKVQIGSGRYARDFSKPDPECVCYTCLNFTKAYVSHLFRSHEMLAGTLATIHNVHFMTDLMRKIRESIREDRFESFKKEFLSLYR